jgi:hypothetical protein
VAPPASTGAVVTCAGAAVVPAGGTVASARPVAAALVPTPTGVTPGACMRLAARAAAIQVLSPAVR